MQRIASVLAVGAALMLPARAPAAGASPSAGAPDRQMASQLLVKCLRDSIPKLDDFRSDASTIAKGALGVCRQEIVSVFQASGSPDPQGMADQAPALGTFEQIATAITLERRVAMNSHRHGHGAKALRTGNGEAHAPVLRGGPGRNPHAVVNKASAPIRPVPRSPCVHYPYCS